MINNILRINAHLKYVEYLLHVFDNYSDEATMKQIREEFAAKFHINSPLLNQHFGIYRLLPLLFIKEEYKKDKKELSGLIEKVKIIRDSVCHNNFSIDEKGYHFQNDKGNFDLSIEEYQKFIYEIENTFYDEKRNLLK